MLKELVDSAGDDHKKLLKEVNARYSGKEKRDILIVSMNKFEQTADVRKDFIKELAKGNIDQDFLISILHNELAARNNREGNGATPGLIDLLMMHIDFSHVSKFSKENILCEAIAPLFSQTQLGIEQTKELMRNSPFSIMGGAYDDLDLPVMEVTYDDLRLPVMEGAYNEMPSFDGESLEMDFMNDDLTNSLGIGGILPQEPAISEKEWKRRRNIDNQRNVELLLSYAGDPETTCKDDLTVKQKLSMLEEENILVNEELGPEIKYLVDSSTTKNENTCIDHLDNTEFLELCGGVSILNKLITALNTNEKVKSRQRIKKTLNNHYIEQTEKCNFSLIDNMMMEAGLNSKRKIRLQLRPNNDGFRSFVLEGRTREEFIRKLKKLVNYEE